MENEIVYSNLNSKPSPTPTLDCLSLIGNQQCVCEFRSDYGEGWYPIDVSNADSCAAQGCTGDNSFFGGCHDIPYGTTQPFTYSCQLP
jgi:hypothetical protein